MSSESQKTESNEDVDAFQKHKIDSIEFLKRNVEGYDINTFYFLGRLQEDINLLIKEKLDRLHDEFSKAFSQMQFIQPFEKFRTLGNTVEITTEEYNCSCRCHPEYCRDTFTLPVVIADSKEDNIVFNYLIKKLEKEKRDKEEIAIRKAEESGRGKEESERAEFFG